MCVCDMLGAMPLLSECHLLYDDIWYGHQVQANPIPSLSARSPIFWTFGIRRVFPQVFSPSCCGMLCVHQPMTLYTQLYTGMFQIYPEIAIHVRVRIKRTVWSAVSSTKSRNPRPIHTWSAAWSECSSHHMTISITRIIITHSHTHTHMAGLPSWGRWPHGECFLALGFALQPVSWQRSNPNSSTLDGYYPPSRLVSNFI